MFTQILGGVIGYIVYQINVFMAILIVANMNAIKNKKIITKSLIYLSGCLGLIIGFAMLDYYKGWYMLSMVTNIFVWCVVLGWLFFIVKEKWPKILFYVFFSAVMLFMIRGVYVIVDTVCLYLNVGIFPWLNSKTDCWWACILIDFRRLLYYAGVSIVVHFSLRKFLRRSWQNDVDKSLLITYGLITLLSLFFMEFENVWHEMSSWGNVSSYVLLLTCEVLYGLLAMWLLAFISIKIHEERYRVRAQMDLDVIKNLWKMDKKQYDFVKENIDIINVKCHDLRHIVNNMSAQRQSVQQEIASIEKTVGRYDSIVHTGNEVCDLILTEKSLQCMQKDICIFCMVDGAALHFVDEISLFSLFGNAIENAIQYVEKFDDPEKRFISLNVHKKDNMVVIMVENIYEGGGEFQNGLPLTDKQNKNYHGFGMKSMQKIAEKYEGELSVTTEDGIFRLTIILPCGA